MEELTKEVYFDQYCPTCKNESTMEEDVPCHECLNHPYNYASHKPVNWSKKD